MSDEVKVWERQDGETEDAYEAFKGYCFQTTPRRLTHSSVKHSTAQLSSLYNDWRWRDRVLAYDRHIDTLRREEREALLKQDEKDRLAKWVSVLESTGAVIEREITKLMRDSAATQAFGLVKPAELTKLMATWITMQRLVHGQSTENVDVRDERLERLSIDELRELQRIEAKLAEDSDEGAGEVH